MPMSNRIVHRLALRWIGVNGRRTKMCLRAANCTFPELITKQIFFLFSSPPIPTYIPTSIHLTMILQFSWACDRRHAEDIVRWKHPSQPIDGRDWRVGFAAWTYAPEVSPVHRGPGSSTNRRGWLESSLRNPGNMSRLQRAFNWLLWRVLPIFSTQIARAFHASFILHLF